jgi:hypothetical protein
MTEVFLTFVEWASFLFGAFVIGMSLAVFMFYSNSKHMKHIAMMSFSYSVMAVLLSLTVNFRIFYEGIPRFIGAVALLTAYVVGTVGLLLIFSAKKKEIHESDSIGE